MEVHAKISERLAPRFKIVQISSRERLLGKYRYTQGPRTLAGAEAMI